MILLGFVLGSLLVGLVYYDDKFCRTVLAIITFILIAIIALVTANQTEYEVTTNIIKEYKCGETIEVVKTQTLDNVIVSDTTYVLQKFKHKIK